MLNRQWLNVNSSWAYPVDEAANERSDEGRLLPTDLIADLSVRWPIEYGEYAYVSSVLVSPTLVAVTLQVSTTPGGDFQPLASVSVRKSSLTHQPYPLEPALPGVGGWIAFGGRALRGEEWKGRFSSSVQTRLSGRAGRPYRPLPVTSLGRLGSAGFTGDVGMTAQTPLRIDYEQREIDGQVRDCYVWRLGGALIGSVPVFVDGGQSVFAAFAGPCGGRPETRTCPDPQPIEFVNSVGPDCDGMLTIRFKGCARITPLQPRCGVAVNCDVSLEDSCKPPRLANELGLLPSEYEPEVIEDEPDVVVPPTPVSEPFQPVAELPYLQCFGGEFVSEWLVKSGEFSFALDDPLGSPCPPGSEPASEPAGNFAYATEGPGSASLRNVSIWNGFDSTTLFRRCRASIKMMPGPLGARRNAGIVINWKMLDASRHTYYLAEVDHDAMKLRISRFNGSSFAVLADALLTNLVLERWYYLETTVTPQLGSANALITASLYDMELESAVASIGETAAGSYYPSTGKFGLSANRAHSRFGWFSVREFAG